MSFKECQSGMITIPAPQTQEDVEQRFLCKCLLSSAPLTHGIPTWQRPYFILIGRLFFRTFRKSSPKPGMKKIIPTYLLVGLRAANLLSKRDVYPITFGIFTFCYGSKVTQDRPNPGHEVLDPHEPVNFSYIM